MATRTIFVAGLRILGVCLLLQSALLSAVCFPDSTR